MRGLIQVAGVIDEQEAQLLNNAGVDRIGFPLRLAVHREDISEDDAARIISSLKPPIDAILITYLKESEDILDLCRKLSTQTVQLHSDISLEQIAGLRALAPKLSIIKSLIVRGDNLSDLEHSVNELAPYVDAFITDTFDPTTGACGATGRTHNWDISRRLVEMCRQPVILAGGLDPQNVCRAILHVRPSGVDVHTGVERLDGKKDKELLEVFVREARAAFALLG